MTVFGWDASDYDHSRGSMDMRAAAADGISFFTHKATEGASVQHHPGPALTGARNAGIPFLGVYMVPRSGPTVAAQVDFLLAWMDQQAPWWSTFPGWFWQMDTEHWGYDAVTAQRGHDCAVLLAQRTGKRVLHYAPEWAYGGSVPAGEPLWASSYVTGSGPYRGLYPGDGSAHWHAYSGRVPSILQFTSSATVGTQPSCDVNAFRGTAADFAALIDQPTIAPTSGAFMTALSDDQQHDIWEWLALIVDPNTPPGGRPGDRFHFPSPVARVLAAVQAVAVPTFSDEQLGTIATDIATALVASNANGLTAEDHAAVRADIIAVLGTVRVG